MTESDMTYAASAACGTGAPGVTAAGSGGKGSREPTWGTPEWHRLHPIFGTDFSRPPSVAIEQIRTALARLRGQLSDLGRGYPGWREQLEDAEGLLTCGISYLHGVMLEMRRLRDPAPPDPAGIQRSNATATPGAEAAQDKETGRGTT